MSTLEALRDQPLIVLQGASLLSCLMGNRRPVGLAMAIGLSDASYLLRSTGCELVVCPLELQRQPLCHSRARPVELGRGEGSTGRIQDGRATAIPNQHEGLCRSLVKGGGTGGSDYSHSLPKVDCRALQRVVDMIIALDLP